MNRRKIIRLALPLGLILLACAGIVIYLGSLRPFAPSARAVSLLPTVETPTRTITPSPRATPTVAPARTHSPPPQLTDTDTPNATSTPDSTRVAFIKLVPTSASDLPLDVRLTQTAVLAEKTLEAIEARAQATFVPTRGASPTPRPVDTTTTILLLGSDLRPTDPNWEPNTDVIMVAFIDTANSRVSILSFPRDMVVAIPHHEAFRINYVYHEGEKDHPGGGGPELLRHVLHDEFGIRIDHWALIDFNGLQKIINTVGGIDVTVPCALEDTIDEQPFVIPAGPVHMDYLTAKRYVQSRYTTSDTSRNFRQQRVLWAIVKKGLALNMLDRVPTLWNQLHESVMTDMSLFDLVGMIPAGYSLDLKNHPERLHAQVLEDPVVYPYIASSGAWLYMPNYAAINNIIAHLFDAPTIAPAKADLAECPATIGPTVTPRASTPTPTPTPGG